MKHLLLCIALVFGIVASANADESEAPKWTVDAHSGVNFPYTYVWNECTVHVRSAGAGIVVEAVDPSWRGMHITQTIVIEKHLGGAVYKLAFTKETGVTNSGAILSIDTEGYDVFESKCVEAVKSLPKGIQKAFHGFYGIVGN